MTTIKIIQSTDSDEALLAAKIIDDGESSEPTQLVPGQAVSVGDADGGFRLDIVSFISSGSVLVKLQLEGATFNGGNLIEVSLYSQIDGDTFMLEAQP